MCDEKLCSAICQQKTPYVCHAKYAVGIAATTSSPYPNLSTLRLLIFINAAIGTLGIDTTSSRELLIIVHDSAVDILLEDGVLLDVLELGLEVLQASSVGAAVGTAASVVDVETLVLDFLAIDTPVYGSQLCAEDAGSM